MYLAFTRSLLWPFLYLKFTPKRIVFGNYYDLYAPICGFSTWPGTAVQSDDPRGCWLLAVGCLLPPPPLPTTEAIFLSSDSQPGPLLLPQTPKANRDHCTHCLGREGGWICCGDSARVDVNYSPDLCGLNMK